MKCTICEIGCILNQGGTGQCGMYTLKGSNIEEVYPDRYLTMFPISIETVPVLHFNPRGKFLQISTIGCNFRCGGCVSENLTAGMETISGGLQHMNAEDVVKKALEEKCLGIVFCLNDPVVSLNTFASVAAKAREKGLYAGCSTNCYFTDEALDKLTSNLDFINIGFKGFTDAAYRSCGAPGIYPVLRNMRKIHSLGIHVEASVIYSKGRDAEILNLTRHIAAISADIPFQIMRFVPFGDASIDDETTIYESELLCDKIREFLPYTYLFNSPGTDRLNTVCPECGEIIAEREFFGPMGSRVLKWRDNGICSCGFHIPLKGNFHEEAFHEPGFFGGYRTTRAMEIIQSIISALNPSDKNTVYSVWAEIMKTGYLHEFHKIMQKPECYRDLVESFARKTETVPRGKELTEYLDKTLEKFKQINQADDGPGVYYAMGHPLFALNAERIEVNLVTMAGGYCVNREITRQGKPGVNITPEEFNSFNPEYIFISGFISSPVSDFYRYCEKNNLKASAIENKKIYPLPPSWDFGSLRWVLGLHYIAGILFPEKFPSPVHEEAEKFYRLFYNLSYDSVKPNRSFYRIKGEA